MEVASKKLKIAFFGEDFSRKAMGTALVVQKIAEQFLENFSDKIELVLIRKTGICSHPIAKRIRNIEIKVYKTTIFSTLISYLIFFLTAKEKFDAIIFNRNVYPGFWLLNSKKFLLLLYDAPANPVFKIKMSFDIKLIDFFLKYFGKYFLDAIIAISESAKKEIVNYYKIPFPKTFYIYGGVSENFQPFSLSEKEKAKTRIAERYGIHHPYILDVSRLDPQKNLETLIDAFSFLKEKKLIPHQLVIVGGRHLAEYTIRIEDKIAKAKFGKKILIAPYIEEEDLPAIYNLADLLVYPSLLEGFGLPIIEAMKCGIPVIASNIPVLSEVAGGAAALVDSRDPEKLASKISEVLDDKELRNDLISRGLERSKFFSWQKTAEDIFRIISNQNNL